MSKRPAYYAPTGSVIGDLTALLHGPYTLWHLSYVAIGAGLADAVDWEVLGGSLLAFFFGTGIAAHSLDELHSRPLSTTLSRRTLKALTATGFAASIAVAIVGAYVLSPWVLAWASGGIALAAGYAVEQPLTLHTPLGFALAWGAFPLLVGYWSQQMALDWVLLPALAFATLTSLAQRSLSTSARDVRRAVDRVEVHLHRSTGVETWGEERLLTTWEPALRLLAWALPVLAVALVLRHAG